MKTATDKKLEATSNSFGRHCKNYNLLKVGQLLVEKKSQQY